MTGPTRRAFAADLPAELLARRTKGILNSHNLAIARENMPFFRESMLDGVLVKERLLERRRIEEVLEHPHDHHASALVDLLEYHFDLEMWLRSWQGAAQIEASSEAA